MQEIMQKQYFFRFFQTFLFPLLSLKRIRSFQTYLDEKNYIK
ncbi:Hypothetical Protein SLY_0101 [Strawberry lethal yellows phytoplasma (CPA) str. NZSb11]|uniref:Uncharacterized protein n=1 Tax=Strawberry lethal yellows phytoplasma (CPA) str. NZSb11 TaxID=980422 RepID=R4RW10_PHYAS|nr:Hypothetical Protein SLY_0101 [Strawberry lethal yellows phytoplasma (CPA) str. NZSb11]